MNANLVSNDPLQSAPQPSRISLGEGNTPLVRSRNIGPALGLSNLYFKLENLNPTGSYKDRFAAALVSEMVSNRQTRCIATSSGNTGAALAAYCAAAQIKCIIVVVDGAPLPKLKQMQLYGAELLMIDGFGTSAEVTGRVMDHLEKLTRELHLPLPISAYRFCASGMAGVESISHEILDVLEGSAEIFVPAGGGGLTLAVARGVLTKKKQSKVHCIQPEGNDTIASSLRTGVPAKSVGHSTTRISGLQVANVLDGNDTIAACKALRGTGQTVSDETILRWHKELAFREGIFCEPAGAVALAGVEKAILNGEIDPSANIVCLITGSGFKDMATVESGFSLPPVAPAGMDNSFIKLSELLS
ncbi:PLP-dependent lyase/thiolase [Dyadobacter sp. CY323]|uniref:PLP-dependent lyase/thiolase n=1 Tax=Dyadobacter sp. CY323 TaxID=2907302 RepID=UPI001F3F2332|nr:PLP-dependent lyase/thiolase [Dyadobacter sp. CY323]MCE6988568.1 PLP-dependent lyase/thiolase [Dyadobacter sp. CY323]